MNCINTYGVLCDSNPVGVSCHQYWSGLPVVADVKVIINETVNIAINVRHSWRAMPSSGRYKLSLPLWPLVGDIIMLQFSALDIWCKWMLMCNWNHIGSYQYQHFQSALSSGTSVIALKGEVCLWWRVNLWLHRHAIYLSLDSFLC